MILPQLLSLQTYNFTLYGSGKEIIVNLDKSTTILAGANGLGKSTFLNLIVYALTGIIKNPSYSFKGIYDINSMDFSKEYFNGRISNTDIPSATIKLKMKLNSKVLSVNRKFDTSGGFDSFQIDNETIYNESDYKKYIIENVGLTTFEQFIFIINYVLLFDESRSILFWDNRILTSAINIFLGIDSILADKSDMLTKRINAADSSFRNTTWQISNLEKYILENVPSPISTAKSKIVTPDVIDEYNSLLDKQQDLLKNIEENELVITSTKGFIMDLSSKVYQLKREYDKEYQKLFNILSPKELIINNSDIHNLLSNKHCNFCNSSDVDLSYFMSKLDSNLCPICDSSISKDNSNVDVSLLEKMDVEIGSINLKLNNAILQREKLEKIKSELESKRFEISESIDHLSNEFGSINLKSRSTESLSKSESELNILKRKREEFRNDRDAAKLEALEVREQVYKKLSEIQEDFVPIFRKLANSFLGLEVSFNIQEITVYHRPEFKFQLIIEDSERFYEHQLSESQRFFVDIALRMSFILYTQKNGNGSNHGGFLLLDTPEGSLDLAYEINAGIMLSEYVKMGSQLFMTTNINSSGLLKALARNSSKSDFELINMINWSQLSLVQSKNKDMIEQKLLEIENEVGEDYEPLN